MTLIFVCVCVCDYTRSKSKDYYKKINIGVVVYIKFVKFYCVLLGSRKSQRHNECIERKREIQPNKKLRRDNFYI